MAEVTDDNHPANGTPRKNAMAGDKNIITVQPLKRSEMQACSTHSHALWRFDLTFLFFPTQQSYAQDLGTGEVRIQSRIKLVLVSTDHGPI